MNGKCPACGEIVNRLVGETVCVDSNEHTANAFVYRCCHCNVVLGFQVDPAAIQRNVALAIDDAFRHRAIF
jgi:hypothetical protein